MIIISFFISLMIFENYGYSVYFSNIFTPMINLIVVLLLFYAAIVSKAYGRMIYLAWLLLAFSQVCFLLGDILRGLFEIGLIFSSTYPAELFYALYYLLFIMAILFLSNKILSFLNQLKLLTDILIVLFSATLITLIFFILPFLANNQPLNVLWIVYIFLDLFLLMALISLFIRFKKNQTPLILLSVGILFFIIVNSIFAFNNLDGGYISGSITDIGWITGYIFIGLAAISQMVNDDIDFGKYIPGFTFYFTRFEWNIYIPLILVSVAYICNIWAYRSLVSNYLYILDYIVGTIVFLVIIRQIITLKENKSLYLEARKEINKRKMMENALQKSEKKYREIVENASEGIVSMDSNGLLAFSNDRFTRMLGYKENELNRRDIFSLMSTESRKIAETCMINIKKGKKGHGELKFIKKDETHLDVLINVSPIMIDNRYKGCLALISDITEAKKAQKQIEDSLIEKEALLREIHHRVKNNMQIISSMLSLQSNYIKDEEMREIFAESRNRVKSMALVHEKLYTSDDISKIKIKDYLRDIISYLVSFYGLDHDLIEFEIYAEDISLNIDTAVPLCLVMNELLTNSLKYAFSHENSDNKITIKITPVNDEYELLIEDNGIGIGEDFNLDGISTLGLKIVNVLVQQLNGSIELLKTGGTAFKIVFRENH